MKPRLSSLPGKADDVSLHRGGRKRAREFQLCLAPSPSRSDRQRIDGQRPLRIEYSGAIYQAFDFTLVLSPVRLRRVQRHALRRRQGN